MPKRTDIRKILIIGAGPIIIGQACEFDYSGTQACKALKDEGYEVILVNSNPATIMTDPEFAHQTYIEPITADYVEKVIENERPDAILPTMGGQTSLNTAVELAKRGVLDKYNVELIGAKLPAIEVAEDREKFKDLMETIGLKTPTSAIANTVLEGHKIAERIGFPVIVRPAFTLGGYGGGIAYNYDELDAILVKGLSASPVDQVLVEQSIMGWKEIEFEVMRDLADNVVIICSIENLDPMGIHTGDSITVAPTQTISDKEYQALRNASIKIIRAVGVETGGSNIQFALNPENGEILIIEMNPRVSRSSALASKATGFPIAKIAAKLAIGYTLDEIPNDITKKTMASFEPSIDYVVTKIPRFAFEKFPETKDILGTQMKSVGETMAIGRGFKESFQKALRGLESKGPIGFINKSLLRKVHTMSADDREALKEKSKRDATTANSQRIYQVFDALYLGVTIEELHQLTKIDRWFLCHLNQIVEETIALEKAAKKAHGDSIQDKLKSFISEEKLHHLKSTGFSDKQIAVIIESSFKVRKRDIRELRDSYNIQPVYKTIDTCAGEFESYTPYHYSCYDQEDEITTSDKEKVIILGGGPNRIGQGIEFDYCCVHASHALRDAGYESIMVNNNPETVSTDYDTSDKLYFEPITVEDVLSIWNKEKSLGNKLKGVIVQLGGQTPLNISKALESHGVTIIGTSPHMIDLAEDRDRFGKLIEELGLKQTSNAIANSSDEAIAQAKAIGFPLVMRPSYVLGGRGMEIVYSEKEVENWLARVILEDDQFPILIDKFLDNAIEVDVDAISDGQQTVLAGIMEHIEYAGVHSGDSACSYPPQTLSDNILEEIETATIKLAKSLNVIGLMNIQFAVKNEELYILEVNPRASRSVPFISKATGIAWAKLAALIMVGKTIEKLKVRELITKIPKNQVSVKEAVFSFNKFDGSSIFLGPEMKSTGEVMGISNKFPMAFAKAQIAASLNLPKSGKIFMSYNDRDKDSASKTAKDLIDLGFQIVATSGTAKFLQASGLEIEKVLKVNEGRPNITDLLKNGEISLILNVPWGKEAYEDSQIITNIAQAKNIPVITTASGSEATVEAVAAVNSTEIRVKSLQSYLKQDSKTII
ncbi:MAG: carbamoyl-phosphate synthase large subunit [Candidatus Melainabacteria bacterium]|nr:carbamoyl-phosphate synthase large subunit [Candidatus Melainabacteria bacterium]